jgi:hypothetical protein
MLMNESKRILEGSVNQMFSRAVYEQVLPGNPDDLRRSLKAFEIKWKELARKQPWREFGNLAPNEHFTD